MTGRNKLHSLTNFDSPHEWKMNGGLGIAPEAQRNRHAFRFMQGLIWESLLTDSLVFRSQVGYIMIPQHIYPRLCETDPANCDHIPVDHREGSRAPTTYGNMNDDHERLDTYAIQTQNRLEWFLDDVGGNHALQMKNNFYAEQDIRRYSRPGDTVTEYQTAHPRAADDLLLQRPAAASPSASAGGSAPAPPPATP